MGTQMGRQMDAEGVSVWHSEGYCVVEYLDGYSDGNSEGYSNDNLVGFSDGISNGSIQGKSNGFFSVVLLPPLGILSLNQEVHLLLCQARITLLSHVIFSEADVGVV